MFFHDVDIVDVRQHVLAIYSIWLTLIFQFCCVFIEVVSVIEIGCTHFNSVYHCSITACFL